ncbi:MAG: sensor histidine kinase [Bacteroidia bacterium]
MSGHNNLRNLEESESLLRAIIDTAIDGIITIDERGIVESMNPAAARIFGYSPDEVLGRNINMLMPEPFRSQHDQYLINYLTTGVAKIIGIGREVPGLKKDGSIFPFILGISEVKLPNKRIFTGIVHDISALKKTEVAWHETEYLINSIINTAVDGIIVINDRGIIEMYNPAASRLFGYLPIEVIGQNVSMLMPEPDRSLHDSYIQNYLRTGVGKIIGIGREVTAQRKDGTTFPMILSVSEVKLESRTIFTGLVHDITDQKMAEERLRRYAAELERSNSELQDFAYVSSHDLQEPLRKIQSFGDRVLTKEYDKLSDDGKDYINRMLNAAQRMQNLINDLLAFSRLTTKAKPFSKVDLNTVLKGVLSDLEVTIEQTGAIIKADHLPQIEAEPTQMRQLFQNLISNAIKFRKENETPVIKIKSKIIQRQAHLTATPGDEKIELTFEDNGIGFDEKYLDKIFAIFQRLEGQKYEGSGIGLAVCRKIAIRHGGDITAKSKPGHGAKFIVKLAIRQSEQTAENH